MIEQLKNDIAKQQNIVAANKAAMITLPKHHSEKITVKGTCGRCGGSGAFGPRQVYGGKCFWCEGSGVGLERVWRKVWPAGTTEEQRQAFEEEAERRRESQRAKDAIKRLQRHLDKALAAEQGSVDFLAANEGLAEALQGNHDILKDLAANLKKWGSLTEAQVKLAFKISADLKARAEEAAAAQDAPTGRVTVTGTVISTKERFGHYGVEYKMLLKATEGYKVWTTIPKALGFDGLKGQQVTIKVTLQPSNDDPKFAFGSRPTAA